ncbi:LamG-like jellyroll fold domain-containing protein [Desertihabitans aurantiacus]|uniref:LamG-like jellyroll fold domain-containing protein n=1 Tax=Desertihabitans aurantiacus TaxID=2282477 RepID=UPI000DF86AD6|nr:LamG-like jellyroll fold domain-containing protein [Desertihabitans aurantiacus]
MTRQIPLDPGHSARPARRPAVRALAAAVALGVGCGLLGPGPSSEADEPAPTTSTWRLDGDARDAVGDRHGEASAGVTFADGSARFSGADDSEVLLPHDPDLEPGDGGWRLELADVVPGALTGRHQAIATSRSTTNEGWAFYIMPNGEFRFWSRVAGQSAWAQFATGVTARPGTSYDIAVEWRPGTVDITIGGGAQLEREHQMRLPVVNNGSNPVRLGNGGDRGTEFFYRGSLGEVTLSAVPRSDDWALCQADGTASAVVTPDRRVLERPLPTDEVSQLALTAARNANRWVSTTYWEREFGAEDGERINLAQRMGNTEYAMRGPAMTAVSSAVLLATGAYDPADTGVSEAEARERVVRLVSSAAAEHRANDPGGWGTESTLWQSSLWAYYNGFAAWLLWDDLSPAQRACVTNMVVAEAEAMPDPEYYRDADGTIIRPGNTQAEENAWRSSLSGLAATMMPEHEDAARWQSDALELALAAWATPQDVASTDVVNGRQLDELLDGSNVEPDGTVENHNLMHPIYMLAFDQNVNNALAQQLTSQLPARAYLHNVDLTYEAFVDLEFPSPPWRPPGGTIYVPGSDQIHYPDGNDWGTTFPLYFAQADVIADSFGAGGEVSVPPREWALRHLQAAVDLQERFADGHTYLDTTESNYRLREERTAQIAAHTFLTRFLGSGAAPCFTDRPYSTGTRDPLQGEMELAWQALDSAEGQALPVKQQRELRAALERVAAADNRGEERLAVRLLQRLLDRDTSGSPAVEQIRAAADSAAGCVLDLPGTR